VEELMKNIG